ncbi:Hypothetical Protein OBI_RACECAR_90 [Arthrobacter phage Racecar]|nr:hypothetical protein PBI_RACECAR_172 [Arthrobacter phage Racecar]QFG12845.1 hypothetical protein PBI_MIMI_169 [Arthrobacter phage Mimi]
MWSYVDGHHLRKGVDLKKLFNETDSERTFNIIDDILVEDAIRDAQSDSALTKVRAAIDKAYSPSTGLDGEFIYDYSNIEYIEPTEDGYNLGFDLPPLG